MKRVFAATALVACLSGCSHIMNGQTQAVTFKSEPEGAALTVTNLAGEKIHTGTTPTTVTLARGAGYFKAETYTISMVKDGYAPKELKITGTMSGWYIGNLLFGGLIGMLAVDPVTGAMYIFPDAVTGKLEETASAAPAKTSKASDTLTIVSTDSLTPEQMKHARLLQASR